MSSRTWRSYSRRGTPTSGDLTWSESEDEKRTKTVHRKTKTVKQYTVKRGKETGNSSPNRVIYELTSSDDGTTDGAEVGKSRQRFRQARCSAAQCRGHDCSLRTKKSETSTTSTSVVIPPVAFSQKFKQTEDVATKSKSSSLLSQHVQRPAAPSSAGKVFMTDDSNAVTDLLRREGLENEKHFSPRKRLNSDADCAKEEGEISSDESGTPLVQSSSECMPSPNKGEHCKLSPVSGHVDLTDIPSEQGAVIFSNGNLLADTTQDARCIISNRKKRKLSKTCEVLLHGHQQHDDDTKKTKSDASSRHAISALLNDLTADISQDARHIIANRKRRTHRDPDRVSLQEHQQLDKGKKRTSEEASECNVPNSTLSDDGFVADASHDVRNIITRRRRRHCSKPHRALPHYQFEVGTDKEKVETTTSDDGLSIDSNQDARYIIINRKKKLRKVKNSLKRQHDFRNDNKETCTATFSSDEDLTPHANKDCRHIIIRCRRTKNYEMAHEKSPILQRHDVHVKQARGDEWSKEGNLFSVVDADDVKTDETRDYNHRRSRLFSCHRRSDRGVAPTLKFCAPRQESSALSPDNTKCKENYPTDKMFNKSAEKDENLAKYLSSSVSTESVYRRADLPLKRKRSHKNAAVRCTGSTVTSVISKVFKHSKSSISISHKRGCTTLKTHRHKKHRSGSRIVTVVRRSEVSNALASAKINDAHTSSALQAKETVKSNSDTMKHSSEMESKKNSKITVPSVVDNVLSNGEVDMGWCPEHENNQDHTEVVKGSCKASRPVDLECITIEDGSVSLQQSKLPVNVDTGTASTIQVCSEISVPHVEVNDSTDGECSTSTTSLHQKTEYTDERVADNGQSLRENLKSKISVPTSTHSVARSRNDRETNPSYHNFTAGMKLSRNELSPQQIHQSFDTSHRNQSTINESWRSACDKRKENDANGFPKNHVFASRVTYGRSLWRPNLRQYAFRWMPNRRQETSHWKPRRYQQTGHWSPTLHQHKNKYVKRTDGSSVSNRNGMFREHSVSASTNCNESVGRKLHESPSKGYRHAKQQAETSRVTTTPKKCTNISANSKLIPADGHNLIPSRSYRNILPVQHYGRYSNECAKSETANRAVNTNNLVPIKPVVGTSLCKDHRDSKSLPIMNIQSNGDISKDDNVLTEILEGKTSNALVVRSSVSLYDDSITSSCFVKNGQQGVNWNKGSVSFAIKDTAPCYSSVIDREKLEPIGTQVTHDVPVSYVSTACVNGQGNRQTNNFETILTDTNSKTVGQVLTERYVSGAINLNSQNSWQHADLAKASTQPVVMGSDKHERTVPSSVFTGILFQELLKCNSFPQNIIEQTRYSDKESLEASMESGSKENYIANSNVLTYDQFIHVSALLAKKGGQSAQDWIGSELFGRDINCLNPDVSILSEKTLHNITISPKPKRHTAKNLLEKLCSEEVPLICNVAEKNSSESCYQLTTKLGKCSAKEKKPPDGEVGSEMLGGNKTLVKFDKNVLPEESMPKALSSQFKDQTNSLFLHKSLEGLPSEEHIRVTQDVGQHGQLGRASMENSNQSCHLGAILTQQYSAWELDLVKSEIFAKNEAQKTSGVHVLQGIPMHSITTDQKLQTLDDVGKENWKADSSRSKLQQHAAALTKAKSQTMENLMQNKQSEAIAAIGHIPYVDLANDSRERSGWTYLGALSAQPNSECKRDWVVSDMFAMKSWANSEENVLHPTCTSSSKPTSPVPENLLKTMSLETASSRCPSHSNYFEKFSMEKAYPFDRLSKRMAQQGWIERHMHDTNKNQTKFDVLQEQPTQNATFSCLLETKHSEAAPLGTPSHDEHLDKVTMESCNQVDILSSVLALQETRKQDWVRCEANRSNINVTKLDKKNVPKESLPLAELHSRTSTNLLGKKDSLEVLSGRRRKHGNFQKISTNSGSPPQPLSQHEENALGRENHETSSRKENQSDYFDMVSTDSDFSAEKQNCCTDELTNAEQNDCVGEDLEVISSQSDYSTEKMTDSDECRTGNPRNNDTDNDATEEWCSNSSEDDHLVVDGHSNCSGDDRLVIDIPSDQMALGQGIPKCGSGIANCQVKKNCKCALITHMPTQLPMDLVCKQASARVGCPQAAVGYLSDLHSTMRAECKADDTEYASSSGDNDVTCLGSACKCKDCSALEMCNAQEVVKSVSSHRTVEVIDIEK